MGDCGCNTEEAGFGFPKVSSVGLSMPSTLFSVANSPISTSGTITVTLNNAESNKVFCGPDGLDGTPTFRYLSENDIPLIHVAKLNDFPSQVGNANKVLKTDGLNLSWGVNSASVAWGGISGTLSNQTDLQTALNAKQATLVNQSNIKSINGASILGSGDLTVTSSGTTWGNITGTLSAQTDLNSVLSGKQATLISGTNIRTVNGNTLLGSTDITVQAQLNGTGFVKASGTSISYDSSTYLTSLTGAVLTDQTTPQTIGLTGSRLAKLWATDITVTNSIAGSVTGSAASFTGSLTGDVTGTQGATAISAATVTGKLITGFVSGAGTVAATDTILQAINKLDGNVGGKQTTLISGSNLRTVNGNTLLGSTDITVQATLVSGSNLRTVNGNTLLGSTDITVQATLISGTNIKTINGSTILGSGDLTVTATFRTCGTAAAFSSSVINVDSYDGFDFTAQNATIANMTSGLAGTPARGQHLRISIVGTGTYDVTSWGTSFESGAATLPTTGAITTTRKDYQFIYNYDTSKWRLMAIG